MNLLRSRKLYRLTFALLFAASSQLFTVCSADTLLFFDYEDDNGQFELNPEFAFAGLDVQTWTVLSSSIRDFAGNPARAMASSGFDTGNRFELMVNLDPGAVVELSGFSFDQLASASGPGNWALTIDGVEIANGLTTNTFATESGAFSLAPLTETFTIGLGAAGASSNRGTWRIDNFTFTGAVHPVPLPASLGLLAGACLALGSVRRTHASAVTGT